MEYIKIIMRVTFFYFFIILIYRLMGKREVGQLGIVDLIVSILIAELVAISIEDNTKSIMVSVIPILSLVMLQIILSYVSLKSGKVRELLDGSPSFIINNGKINYREMIKQKYNLDDLLSQLRERGHRNIEDIEYAILENNGKLSIFEYNVRKENSPFPMPIILDGKIQYDTLKNMGKKDDYIKDILNAKGIKLEDVFYAFYKNKNIFIIKNSEIKK